MPNSFFYANCRDIGLNLTVIGKIGLGFIEEPFDVFAKGRLSVILAVKAPKLLAAVTDVIA